MLRRRKPRLTPEQVLGSVPLRNKALKSERIEGGGIKLVLERRQVWWARMLAIVFPIPKERVVELDALGEQFWDLCDGKRTLRELIRVCQEEHKLTRVEAEWSLRTFLRDLGKRGLVGFVVEGSEENKGERSHARGD